MYSEPLRPLPSPTSPTIQGVEPAGPGPSLTERNRILDSVGAADTATIPLLEIGVLAFPGGTEEFIVYELRYRTLLKGLLEGTRTPRVFGLTAGSVGTLVTLGGWNMMPDGCAAKSLCLVRQAARMCVG